MRIEIDTLNIHRSPHLDEIATAVIVALYGESFFPGVRKALRDLKIDYTEHDWSRPEFIRNRTLPIGTGRETWFNEHEVNGDRMEGYCAFTLATRYLRLNDMAALRRFKQEVYESDTQACCTPTMLAELVKVDHRRQGDYVHSVTKKVIRAGEQPNVFKWAQVAITAIIDRDAQILRGEALRPRRGEKTLRDHYVRWMQAEDAITAETGDVPDKRVRDSMSRHIFDSVRNRSTKVTELAFIVEAMTRTGIPEADIVDWLEYIFNAMKLTQVDFWQEHDRQEAAENDEGAPVLVDALLDGKETKLYLSTIISSSPHAAKVARYRRNRMQDAKGVAKADRYHGITLLRNPLTKNVQIFCDRELRGRRVRAGIVSCDCVLDVAIRMIRTLECIFQNQIPKAFELLGMEGEGPDKIWYYFRKGLMAMNGSTTKDRPATKLMDTQLQTILLHAFHPKLFETWVRDELPRYTKLIGL